MYECNKLGGINLICSVAVGYKLFADSWKKKDANGHQVTKEENIECFL
jgi:hypothetical protein